MMGKRSTDLLSQDGPLQKRSRQDVSSQVASDFAESLSDLSSNDKYQINTLTIIAKENVEHAIPISDALLHHIRTARPPVRLPALYVLDSIVKNVGTPYSFLLARNLSRTFWDTYTAVSDERTRTQMKSLLDTWMRPLPGSHDPNPVFPLATTRPILDTLIKANEVLRYQPTPQPPSQQHHQPPPQQHPQQHHQPQPLPSPYPQTYPQNYPQTYPQPYSQGYPQVPPQHYNPPPNVTPQLPAHLLPNIPSHLLQNFPQNFPIQRFNTPVHSQLQPPPPVQISTPQPASTPLPPPGWAPPQIPPPQAQLQQLQGHQTSTPTISSQPPPAIARLLLSTPLQKTQDSRLNALYPRIPRSDCRQCGRRFKDPAAKTRHLDRHFKTRMSLNSQSTGMGVTRSWFLDDADWVTYREVDDAQEAPAQTNDQQKSSGTLQTGSAAKEEDPWIPVPTDAALRNQTCTICCEGFDSVFDEERQWIWKNAINQGGRISHASCLRDMQSDRAG